MELLPDKSPPMLRPKLSRLTDSIQSTTLLGLFGFLAVHRSFIRKYVLRNASLTQHLAHPIVNPMHHVPSFRSRRDPLFT